MRLLVAIAVWTIATSTQAASERVPVAYSNIANAVGVPDTILYAIAMQESRLLLGELVAPWPWTLNVDGAAHRLPNRAAMGAAIEDAQQGGARFIDVGLMQINLHFNGHRFRSEDEMLDPYANIRVAAEILQAEQQACGGDWWCAVGRYHSRTPERADRYIEGVRQWHAQLGG